MNEVRKYVVNYILARISLDGNFAEVEKKEGEL